MPVVRHKRGAPALLFDRLMTREQPGDRLRPARIDRREVYSIDELKASVAEQLGWLLNTRVPIDYQTMDARTRGGTRTTIDYGLPDLTVYPIGNAAAMTRLGQHLTQTIAIYEPRLHNPRTRLVASPERGDMLTVEVSGDLGIGLVAEPVTFSFPMQFEGPRDGH